MDESWISMGIRWMGQQSSTVLSTVFLSLGLSMEVKVMRMVISQLKISREPGSQSLYPRKATIRLTENPRLHLLMV